MSAVVSGNPGVLRFLVPAIVALSFIWMMVSLERDHSWYDDFAQYVMQAANTARGEPFANTAYVYDPASAGVGPRLYPPVFPLLLAPVVGVMGVNLLLFKIVCVGCFTAGLLVTLALFRRQLTGREQALYALIIGFSPAFWLIKEYIYSEHLFVPLFYTAILLMEMWYVRSVVLVSPVIHAVCLGGVIYATFGTRTVGAVLFPTLVMCELVRMIRVRRALSILPLQDGFGSHVGGPSSVPANSRALYLPTWVGCGAFVVAGLLAALQATAMPSAGAGYLDQLSDLGPRVVLKNLHANTTSLSLLWENGQSEWLRRFGGGLLIIVGLLGYLRCNLRAVTPLGIAVGGYFVAALLWPSFAWFRIVWPILPAFVFYVVAGTWFLSERWRSCRFLPAGVLAFTCVSYAVFYAGADYGPVMNGVESQRAKELYAFVEANTSPSETILFWKPRALALYTGRSVSKFPTKSQDTILKRANAIGASLLVVRNDPDASEFAVARRIPGARTVFTNEGYVAYRLHSTETGHE